MAGRGDSSDDLSNRPCDCRRPNPPKDHTDVDAKAKSKAKVKAVDVPSWTSILGETSRANHSRPQPQLKSVCKSTLGYLTVHFAQAEMTGLVLASWLRSGWMAWAAPTSFSPRHLVFRAPRPEANVYHSRSKRVAPTDTHRARNAGPSGLILILDRVLCVVCPTSIRSGIDEPRLNGQSDSKVI